MFNPNQPEAILNVTADTLTLPPEDDLHEYKCSLTSDEEMKKELHKAASAFWNSGGGLFVGGVNNAGAPDGGINPCVGRQDRRDWVDRVLAEVQPTGTYHIHIIEHQPNSNLDIQPGKVLLMVGFAPSNNPPHQAPNKIYYVRGGAHSNPAPHFLVEALFARRGISRPILRHVVRRKPSDDSIVQLGLINLSPAPALEVQVTLNPIPHWVQQLEGRENFHIPCITQEHPHFFDFLPPVDGEVTETILTLRYRDLQGCMQCETLSIDAIQQAGPEYPNLFQSQRDLVYALRDIARALANRPG